jgi:hypothetical protein
MTVNVNLSGIGELDFPTAVSSASVSAPGIVTVNIKNTLAADDDVLITSPADTQVLTYEAASSKWKNKNASGGGNGAAGIVIGNGNGVPVAGSKGYLQVPYSATIVSWTVMADQIGSAQITVKKCTVGAFPTTSSIVAAAPPNLSSQQINTSSTLTGWTTSITAADILEFKLDSATAVTRIVLELTLLK